MGRTKSELEELITTGYDFEAMMDIGNGWEPYEGCTQNLLMILEDPDTGIEIISEEYRMTLPSWWRKGAITISFDEAEL